MGKYFKEMLSYKLTALLLKKKKFSHCPYIGTFKCLKFLFNWCSGKSLWSRGMCCWIVGLQLKFMENLSLFLCAISLLGFHVISSLPVQKCGCDALILE